VARTPHMHLVRMRNTHAIHVANKAEPALRPPQLQALQLSTSWLPSQPRYDGYRLNGGLRTDVAQL
jgi:hypothetical protein